MAARPLLRSFEDEDRFLRRVAYPDHIRRGLVHWRAFRETGPSLSLTLQTGELRTEPGLELYQSRFRFQSGDLPGICWLSFLGLTKLVAPPLEPHWDSDETDPHYGHLHCCTAPPTKPQAERLAKLVNDDEYGGLLRDFVEHTSGTE